MLDGKLERLLRVLILNRVNHSNKKTSLKNLIFENDLRDLGKWATQIRGRVFQEDRAACTLILN